MIAHVEHIAKVAGDAALVGIGSDLDGGFARDRAAIDSLEELAVLRSALARRFGRHGAEGIMGGNWLRFLDRVLPA